MIPISVVIPTCADRPEMLEAALCCVEEQTVSAHEVLVVNNGDQPLELEDHPKVRSLRIPRRAGVAQARNFGSSLATGEYVAFLDDDDLWEQRYLEKLEATLRDQPADCLLTRLDKLVDGRVIEYKCAFGRLSVEELLVRNPGTTGSCTVVRREAFLQASGYDPKLTTGSDRALVLCMLLQGATVRSAPWIQAILREHDGPRITDHLYQGTLDFAHRHGSLMSEQQLHHNLAKAYRLRFRAQGSELDRLRFLYHKVRNVVAGWRKH